MNSRTRRGLTIAALSAAALCLLFFLTLLFIPDRELQGVVSRLLEKQGYTFSAAEFGKTLPLGVSARNMKIASEQGPLVKADEVSVRLRLLPLLIGKVQISLAARIGAGTINGNYSPAKGGSADLEVNRLQLEEIPFFKTVAEAVIKGTLNVHGKVRSLKKNTSGEVRLEVRGADLAGVKIGQMPLPDAAYHTVQGMLRLKPGQADLESLTLQGDGLFARLKGRLPLGAAPSATPLNLTLELMPKAAFMEKQKFVFLLMTKYLVSPGSYQIPIRGTLAKPAI